MELNNYRQMYISPEISNQTDKNIIPKIYFQTIFYQCDKNEYLVRLQMWIHDSYQ